MRVKGDFCEADAGFDYRRHSVLARYASTWFLSQ